MKQKCCSRLILNGENKRVFQIGFEKCITATFQICFGKHTTNKMAYGKLETNVLWRFGFKRKKKTARFKLDLENAYK